jgi:hypothetical protein
MVVSVCPVLHHFHLLPVYFQQGNEARTPRTPAGGLASPCTPLGLSEIGWLANCTQLQMRKSPLPL